MRHKRLCLTVLTTVLVACVCAWAPACSKKPGSPKEEIASSPELIELTKQVRRYAFEKRKVPQNVEELVTAGYIQAVPKSPAGKKYAIDTKRVQAILVDQ